MANKKFFWIKLRPDFFNDPYIKLLRRMAGGDTYTIIYLEMLIKSAATDGMIYFQGAGNDIGEELALMLDENVEDVRALLAYLEAKRLITHPEITQDLFLVASADLTGSEVDSAKRVREFRQRQKMKALQSNNEVTKGNDKLEIEKELDKEIEIDNTPLPPMGEQSNSRKSKSTKLSEQEKEDFEALWKLYPKKLGKNPAEKAYLKAIRDGIDNKTIQDGIVAYNKKIKAEVIDMQFIKMGSTWFNQRSWDDDYTISVPKNIYGRQVKVEPQITKNDDIQQEITEEPSATTEELMKMLGGRKTRS